MPDRVSGIVAGTGGRLAAVLCLCLSSGSATAAPDWDIVALRDQLRQLAERLDGDREVRSRGVRELVGEIAWSRPPLPMAQPVPYVEPDKPAELGWTNKRHGLASLSQVYGGQDNIDVLQSGREGDMEAIHVISGIAALAQLRARLTHRQMGRDIRTGSYYLRTPIVIAKGATLRLGPDDRLELSRADGAYILNYGRLEVLGGHISATEESNVRSQEFNPFVATVGSGSVQLSGATIEGLGFGYTVKFAGFSILSHPTMRPTQRSVIESSRFEDLVAVAVVGSPHITIRDSLFFAMRSNPILISRSVSAEVEGNLIAGESPSNAIRVTNGSDGTRVVGNALLQGSRAGLVVSSGSDDVVITGNLVWRRNGGGVKLSHVDCARVEDNLILDDLQKGVEVRSSRDAFVHRNRIVGNDTAGVWVSAQEPGVVTYLVDNLIRENGSGLAAATGGQIALSGNDLSNQFPRFLDGDITPLFRAIAADLRGERPLLIDAREARPVRSIEPPACGH